MTSYDDSQLMISQINRSITRNPEKAIELLLQFIQTFGYQEFAQDVFQKCFDKDLAAAAHIAAISPPCILTSIPTTNETAEWKAERLQKLSYAAQTDYWVDFESDRDKLGYLLINLARSDVQRAGKLVKQFVNESEIAEVAKLIYRCVVCKRENAFKLIKSKYVEELAGLEEYYEEVADVWFKQQDKAEQDADSLD